MIIQARQAIGDRKFFNFFKKQCITYRNCNKLGNVQGKIQTPKVKKPFLVIIDTQDSDKESSLPAIRGDCGLAIVIFCDTYQTGKKKNILQIKWTATFLPWPCWFRQNLGGWYFFVNGSSASRESPNRLFCFFNRFLTVSDSSHSSFFCSEALIFSSKSSRFELILRFSIKSKIWLGLTSCFPKKCRRKW